MLAGFLQPDSGTISLNNGDLQCPSIGYVFQNYADTLLPWRTLRSNVLFPLELRRLRASERRRRVDDRLALFGLAEHAHKYIYELSGGLKQLAAIAQATIYDPSLLLLDEPFSALDYSRSRVLWKRFRELWQQLRVSTVFVSHNVDEAIYLGDDVYVLSSRPTRVVERFRVPFGPNRELSILHSEDFMQLRSQVLCAFESGLS
jgi:NitT/TauT family transport system ATP-binding protein